MLAWKCASTQSRHEGDCALFSSQTLRALTGAYVTRRFRKVSLDSAHLVVSASWSGRAYGLVSDVSMDIVAQVKSVKSAVRG